MNAKDALRHLLIGSWLLLGPLRAALEPVEVIVTAEPEIPASLRQEGFIKGEVVLALDVGTDGRLADSLVLAASHAGLIRPVGEAVQSWRFKPARLDGEPVSVRLRLTVNLSRTGVIVSRTVAQFMDDRAEQIGGRKFDYEVCAASELDRPLVAVSRPSPPQIGVAGRAQVHFYVDEQGGVRLPAVPPGTPPDLAAVTVEAMRGWKFAPPTRHGRPVVVAVVQEFDFGGGPQK
jgi:outer membrane biosynthesis protein TonB